MSGDTPGAFGGLHMDAAATGGVEHAADTDQQGTPPALARELKAAVGGRFDVDPCAGAEPEPIAHTRYTEAEDGLAANSPWFGTVFINPPYSDPEPWARRAAQTTRSDGDADLVVMLLPSYSTSAEWFHDWCSEAEYACLVDGRLTFYGADGSAPFASILLAFSDDDYSIPTRLLRTLEEWGDLYENLAFDHRDEQTRFTTFLDDATGGDDQVTSPHPDDPPLAGLTRSDLLSVQFDDHTPGFPSSLPVNPTVKALDGRAVDGRVEVLTVAPDVPWSSDDGDTYVLLSHPEDDPWDVRAAIEEPGHGWRHLILESAVPVVTAADHTTTAAAASDDQGQ